MAQQAPAPDHVDQDLDNENPAELVQIIPRLTLERRVIHITTPDEDVPVEFYDELMDWPQRVIRDLWPIILLYVQKRQMGATHDAVLRTISDSLWAYGFDYSDIAVANKWKSLVRAYRHSLEIQPRDTSLNVNLARFVYLVRMEQLKRRLENYGRCFLTDEIMQEIH